jgi:metal-responsive CopG/Arc/MetJ family transcriptional regulator
MARTATLVQLSDTLLSALDERAAKRGISRSQLIREAIEAHLGGDLEAEISSRIVEGYRRVPDDREFDAWTTASAREMIAEEPW